MLQSSREYITQEITNLQLDNTASAPAVLELSSASRPGGAPFGPARGGAASFVTVKGCGL
jgi:hypothetical protein